MKKVLCVDDDARILEAFQRQFRKQFDIRTALGPELGLKAISEDGPFAVVVSDLRMPAMNGIEFLARVRQAAPDTVRVMLTGEADLAAAVAAVNDGKVFQFLNKPCPGSMLARTLDSAIEQNRLVTAERELLERTLRGSIGVLSEILSLVNPTAFSRANRILRYVQYVATQLNLPNTWQFEMAAMLSQIGCVTVPTDVLDKHYRHQALNPRENDILASQSRIGHDLLVQIPRLENIAEIVACQQMSWSDRGNSPETIYIGANLLRVALDFDAQILLERPPDAVLAQMLGSRDYNPAFVTALQQLHAQEATSQARLVTLSQLQPSMIINDAVYSKNGMLLLGKGQQVTESALARLESFASLHGIVEPINVIIPNPERQTDSGGLANTYITENSFRA
jgi:response regulator RpfG family c-di-GMP phosphodiesterase